MNILDKTKTSRPRFLGCPKGDVFQFSKKLVWEGVFGFYNEGTPYFDCVKADDFRWN